jgi:hypothetical protein
VARTEWHLEWGRGLLRLWVVVSVLWVAGATIITWPDQNFRVDDWLPNSNKQLLSDKGMGFERNSPPPGFEVDKPPFDPSQKFTVVENPPFDPDAYLALLARRERRRTVQFAILLALLPPVFVLALGSALRWAFMGFRP